MNFERLVENALEAPGERREKYMYALCDAVKEFECEDGDHLAPVERALPRLAEFLLDHENGNVDGCAISIFRRVDISTETMARLLALHRAQPDALVVQAIGLSNANDWTSEVESVLAAALSNDETAHAAANALYCNERVIKQSATLDALANAMRYRDRLFYAWAVAALACQTKRTNGAIALQLLNDALNVADAELRALIAETVGWATDTGLSLLQRTAVDSNPVARIATARALLRGYRAQEGGNALLEILKGDCDAAVRAAATEALDGTQ